MLLKASLRGGSTSVHKQEENKYSYCERSSKATLKMLKIKTEKVWCMKPLATGKQTAAFI